VDANVVSQWIAKLPTLQWIDFTRMSEDVIFHHADRRRWPAAQFPLLISALLTQPRLSSYRHHPVTHAKRSGRTQVWN
jgi:hypothetical protein